MDKLIGMKKELKALELAVKCNMPTLLEGETGIGKTYVIRCLAEEHNHKLVRVNLNGETGISELIGKYLLRDGETYWQDGVLLEALRNGSWIVLDEINAALPEVLFVLNSLLDDGRCIVIPEKNNELVVMHPDCRIFATCNPSDEYTGTKDMSKALLSRFAIKLNIDYPSPANEVNIIKYHVPAIHEEEAKLFVDCANAIRKFKKEGKCMLSVGTRDLVNSAKIFTSDGMTVAETLEVSVINKAPTDEQDIIIDHVKQTCSIQFPAKSKVGEFPALLVDYKKSIAELEQERDKLKMELENIETEVVTAIKSRRK